MGFLRKLGDDVGWAAISLSESLARDRGPGGAAGVGRAAGRLLWVLAGGRRRVSLGNARIALPDVPERRRRRVVRKALFDSMSYWPELASYIHDRPRRILGNVAVEGREHLEAALARGKGVIAPSVHLGNFSLIGMWMTQAGYDFGYMIRVPHNDRFFQRLCHLSRRTGIGLIWDRPRRACVARTLRALGRGGIVCVLLDQRAMLSMAGVDVDFFGRPFHAYGGALALALKTGAALVPMYIVREQGIRHRLVIEPELPVEPTGDRRADAEAGLRRLMRRFEGWIRRHPAHWWWPNRRWELQDRCNHR